MRVRPLTRERIVGLLAEQLCTRAGPVRVALDGPPCAEPQGWAAQLVEAVRTLGREAVHIRAEMFWRDASLRLEYGREDPAEYAEWLDAAALRREVLEPLGPGGSGRYLRSLRDPGTNRSTREPARSAGPDTITVLSGALLLGRGLPFEVTVHLAVSDAARRRRTPAQSSWTLPAFASYDARVRPATRADVVVRLDDPRHPALATAF